MLQSYISKTKNFRILNVSDIWILNYSNIWHVLPILLALSTQYGYEGQYTLGSKSLQQVARARISDSLFSLSKVVWQVHVHPFSLYQLIAYTKLEKVASSTWTDATINNKHLSLLHVYGNTIYANVVK